MVQVLLFNKQNITNMTLGQCVKPIWSAQNQYLKIV